MQCLLKRCFASIMTGNMRPKKERADIFIEKHSFLPLRYVQWQLSSHRVAIKSKFKNGLRHSDIEGPCNAPKFQETHPVDHGGLFAPTSRWQWCCSHIVSTLQLLPLSGRGLRNLGSEVKSLYPYSSQLLQGFWMAANWSHRDFGHCWFGTCLIISVNWLMSCMFGRWHSKASGNKTVLRCS